jgi:hypothetical protein
MTAESEERLVINVLYMRLVFLRVPMPSVVEPRSLWDSDSVEILWLDHHSDIPDF